RHRFPIGFSFFKHPKARLRKVASHGHFGFAMAAARFNPLVKSADMIVATALAIENRAVGSFHKGPLQIHIDISTNRSVVKIPSTIASPFLPKASLASSTTNPYFAKVACTRFLSCVLCRLNTMRVRGSSRASRTDEGGIQTVGNVPVLCSRFIPLASSLSLLFTLPIISFASRALTSCGFPPPSSISSTIQYQFPTVSTATGDCLSHRLIKFLMLP